MEGKIMVDTSNYPYVDNYPPLRDWLREHKARCMWQLPMGGDAPSAYVEGCQVYGRMVVIVVHANRGGWEIYSAHPSLGVRESLDDALARCKAVQS